MRPAPKLVVVVADKAYQLVLTELLARAREAGFAPPATTIVPDPFHDSSGRMADLLRPYLRDHDHALVLRDFAGSGYESQTAPRLERDLEEQICRNGWQGRKYAAIVAQPEIEDWLRLPSPAVLKLLRRYARRRKAELEDFESVLQSLITKHGGRDDRGKAHHPKEVFDDLVTYYGIPRSAGLRGYLAKHEPLSACASESFNRLLATLRFWFPRQ